MISWHLQNVSDLRLDHKKVIYLLIYCFIFRKSVICTWRKKGNTI